MQFIDTWNTAYAHPFTWKYTGVGLHEKAISRFNTLLLLETPANGHPIPDQTITTHVTTFQIHITKNIQRNGASFVDY